MAVSTTDTFSGPYAANGVTVEFPFTFKAISPDDVAVIFRNSAGVETLDDEGDFSVELSAAGGKVVYLTPPAASVGDVFIVSEPSFLQSVQFSSGQPFLPAVVNEVNDRDVVRALYLKAQLERAPRTPIGGGVEGRFPVVKPDGGWGFASGTGNDPALRSDLAIAIEGGAGDLLAYKRRRTIDTLIRTNWQKADDRMDVRDFVADIAGNNGETSAYQKAVNAAIAEGELLNHPYCKVVLDAPLLVTGPCKMQGIGTAPYRRDIDGGDDMGEGTWLHVAHSGKGIVYSDGGAFLTGCGLYDIGMYFDQPTPAPGWEPNDNDFAIELDQTDLYMRNVMLLNPTRAIRQKGAHAGRLYMERVRGQPFEIGVQIDDSYEGMIAQHLRWWPMWSNDLYTRAYTQANRRGLLFRHCDNPSVMGYFDFGSNIPIFISGSSGGTTNNALFTAPELDNFGGRALFFDEFADGAHVTFNGGYCYGSPGSTNAVENNAVGVTFRDNGFRYQAIQHSAIDFSGGSASEAYLSAPQVSLWNLADGDHPAFVATPPNRIILSGTPRYSAAYPAPLVNTQETVASDEPMIYPVLAVFPQNGTGMTASATGRLTRRSRRVTGKIVATVTDNGSGGGDLRITLPVPVAPGETFWAGGRNLTTGQMVQVLFAATQAAISTPANGYPVASGQSILINVDYEPVAL